MDSFWLFAAIPVLMSLLAAFFAARFSYGRLVMTENRYATLISILVFIGTAVLVLARIATLILYNVSFDR